MQVIHFETSANRLNKAWLAGCNSILPQDISINWIKKVPEDFHSRFSATKRTYRYHILNGNKQSVLKQKFYVSDKSSSRYKFDAKASNHLIGEKDFSSLEDQAANQKAPTEMFSKLRSRKGKILYL